MNGGKIMLIITENHDTYDIPEKAVEFCKIETVTVVNKTTSKNYLNFINLKIKPTENIKYEGNSCTFEEFVDRITSWNDIDHLVVLNTYYKAPYLKDESGNNIYQTSKINSSGILEISIYKPKEERG